MKNTVEERITGLIEQMTLAEKILLCHGCDSMSVGDIPRLGIGRITMADGPQGVRLEDGRTTTALPSGIALAASFDSALAEEYGALIARECLANDIQVSLGPGFNLMRTPLNGRNFEYYGEDPVLAGEIAVGYIRGCQAYEVAACPKHIALNNQEKCRTVIDVIIDERPLRELYLRAFEIVCKKSQPWMMMSALNAVNGVRAVHNHLLQQQIPKEEFGFDGVMVSDWGAAKDTKAAALGGLDLDMGHGANPVLGGSGLECLVASGEVPEAIIDDKVRRVLRLLFRTGCFDSAKRQHGECNTPRHREFARQSATAGMVLLKNDGKILPLVAGKQKRIAVIGPNANRCHSMGALLNCGGSGAVHPDYEITPLAGLLARLGDTAKVDYVSGVTFAMDAVIPPTLFPAGFQAEYFRPEEKEPFLTETVSSLDFQWGNLFAAGKEATELDGMLFRLRLTGTITPQRSGRVKLIANGARIWGRLFLDGREIIAPQHQIRWRQFIENYSFDAVAGQTYELRIELERLYVEFTEFHLLWIQEDCAELERAVALAAESDLVVYVGGSNHRYDREAVGGDYVPDADIPDLELPDGQEELIRRLIEVNPRIVVVLINGSVLNVESWIARVPALLECWYPGMEGGHAIAEVLFGDAEPGGRLPFTWGKKLEDYACHADGNYPGHCGEDHPNVHYDEGIFIGYRHFERTHIKPRFPFGHGLSYTSFKRKLVDVIKDGDDVVAKVAIENSGLRPGYDVVQLYVRDIESSVERPFKELQAFKKVFLNPGEMTEIELRLKRRSLAFYDDKSHRFIVEPGEFELLFGSSSKDIFAQKCITVE